MWKVIFLTFLLVKPVFAYNGGGAIDNFRKVEKPQRKKVVSPLTKAVSLGGKVKNKGFASIKTQNYNKIEENQVYFDDKVDLYSDFDEIFDNGRYVGYYKVGNPYKIEGILYHPQEYEEYEEVGVASWYGEQFDGKLTANGEIYNLDSMTAAHQTLPLPCVVLVTNLQNGRQVKVRVNDRGPFAKSRIIDLSKKAAGILGYRDSGTATVKVEYLAQDTQKLLKKLKIKR